MSSVPDGFIRVFAFIPRQLEMFERPNWYVYSDGKNVFITGPREQRSTTWNSLMSMKMGFTYSGEIPMWMQVGWSALSRQNRG